MISHLRHITLALLVCISVAAHAQQIPQWSQHMLNKYVHNPAVGGSQDAFEGMLSQRYQWAGINDAPRTFVLSLQGPTKVKSIGLGGMVFTDNVGPTRQTGGQVTYAHHFPITNDWKIGVGLGLGAVQWTIDGDKIQLIDSNDPALFSDLRSKTVFDAQAGVYVYSDKGYLGIAVPHVLAGRVDVFDSQSSNSNRLRRHINTMAGYTFDVGYDWKVTPAMMVKYVNPSLARIDINAVVKYKNMVWLGTGYRIDDAAILMAGYTWRERMSIAYSYDFTVNQLKSYSNGSHEFVFSFSMPQ